MLMEEADQKTAFEQANRLLEACRKAQARLITAESCTGGLIAAMLTAIAGSSDVVEGGFVTYSNAAKTAMLGVDPVLIRDHGAVSAEVAAAMAQGALLKSGVDLALAVTGIAGPGGGSALKPVGLVYIAVAWRAFPVKIYEQRYGAANQKADDGAPPSRMKIRSFSVLDALRFGIERINEGINL